MLQSYFFFLTFHTIVEKNLGLDLYKNHKNPIEEIVLLPEY